MTHTLLAHARRTTLFTLTLLALTACRDRPEVDELRAMQLTADLVPPSPTNAYADDPAAAALGERLFFDKHLSVDGTIACASCHRPDQGFSDTRRFSLGVRGQTGDRHAMPITAVAFQSFTLWDGRGDSLWSQPLKAIENPKEMDLTRVELVRVIATRYADAYEALFGALPSVEALPARGKPGLPAWDALPEAVRIDVDEVAANVGKAIEAYERTLLCNDTRFDRWARGELELTEREMEGARAFVENNCTHCHNGPAFSDGAFHNIGLPSRDVGRAGGRDLLLADPFNGAGLFSDDPDAGEEKLEDVRFEAPTVGAFRTASLRGVGQRRFFGHAGHEETLEGFIEDVYRGGRRGRRNATVGTLDRELRGVNVRGNEVDALVAFLRTLNCPPTP